MGRYVPARGPPARAATRAGRHRTHVTAAAVVATAAATAATVAVLRRRYGRGFYCGRTVTASLLWRLWPWILRYVDMRWYGLGLGIAVWYGGHSGVLLSDILHSLIVRTTITAFGRHCAALDVASHEQRQRNRACRNAFCLAGRPHPPTADRNVIPMPTTPLNKLQPAPLPVDGKLVTLPTQTRGGFSPVTSPDIQRLRYVTTPASPTTTAAPIRVKYPAYGEK